LTTSHKNTCDDDIDSQREFDVAQWIHKYWKQYLKIKVQSQCKQLFPFFCFRFPLWIKFPPQHEGWHSPIFAHVRLWKAAISKQVNARPLQAQIHGCVWDVLIGPSVTVSTSLNLKAEFSCRYFADPDVPLTPFCCEPSVRLKSVHLEICAIFKVAQLEI